MNNFSLSVGNKIKALRKVRGISQNELAVKTGITRTYLAQIENGKVNPSLDKLKKISDNLNTNLFEFFMDL